MSIIINEFEYNWTQHVKYNLFISEYIFVSVNI